MGADRDNKTPIQHSRPFLGEKEAEAVARVIRSGHIAQGKEVNRFEGRFAEYLGVSHAVGASSGTAALHLTLLAMDIGPGDEVIIPTYVCTALLNAVLYVRAEPVLADVCRETGNIDPEDVKKRITARTKAVVVPHMFGLPVKMAPFLDLGLPIIEDCAQSIGSTDEGRLTGTFGIASIFSFYATKVITTGEGGMVVTGSRKIASAVRELREYDKQKDYKVRHNYKMTDMQAAMGMVQLDRLPALIRKRRAIASEFFRRFKGLSVNLPSKNPGHIYYRFVVDISGVKRKAFSEEMRARGVLCERPVSRPIHRYLNIDGYPHAESAWKRLVSVPLYPALSEVEIGIIVHAVKTASFFKETAS
ncbi:MAG: DegT/DnrJ/EryC1/StrS family aminotransferase [Desulfobacterales bacterium]|nr:DegT/DnrJ/EryC1/StrS family aminotransferase [Desulfobacterales bacterium]